MDKGSWFQSRIVLGKNDCCLDVILAYGTTYELVLAERDCFCGFIRCLSESTATCWFTILYIMVKRDSFLLVSSDFHFRSSSRSVTLDLLWYRFFTNLAPLRWTISILLMSTLSCGSQTQLANSTVGLTIDMYAVSLVLVDAIFKFRLKNPRVLIVRCGCDRGYNYVGPSPKCCWLYIQDIWQS